MECVDWNFSLHRYHLHQAVSHSAWSAWIEIKCVPASISCKASHSAWSAWIEISQAKCCASLALVALRTIPVCCRRTPHGVRGLKSPPKAIYFTFLFMSHSAWSAWIEIPNTVIFGKSATGSHSAWSAWIEICFGYCCKDFPYQVALRMECVDWNCIKRRWPSIIIGRTPHGVRLDWNIIQFIQQHQITCATLCAEQKHTYHHIVLY